MTDFTTLIIEQLQLPKILKPAHGKLPPLTSAELISAILEHGKIRPVANSLGSGYQTINRVIHKYFVPIFGNINGGNETWKYILLRSIGYKECFRCGCIKAHSSFGKDAYTADGRYSVCRRCRSYDNTALYNRRKLRIPSWYDSEKELIADFYDNCPDGFHVDHIIPLQGLYVSGLHTISNLQYLPAEENRKKGNHYDGGVEK